MAKRLPRVVSELLDKAKQSALMAVELFNKPTAEFRVQSFIMLMHVAWNSLFLAIFHRGGVKPFYRQSNGYFFVRVHGEKKAWDLAKCIREYWGPNTDAVRKNLEFFMGLRHKIEHYRDQPALVGITFGECQSLVTNFERVLVDEFTEAHALTDRLSLSIQLSAFRNPERKNAILSAQRSRAEANIAEYIREFRSSLSDDIFDDMRFSYKLFLLPKVANHQNRDTVAIEWIDMESLPTERQSEVDRLIAIIKEKTVAVRNPATLRPKEVCERIQDNLGITPFNPSYHHARCWKHYGVRPPTDSPNPAQCDTRYCQYDPTFNAYVYTEAWVDFLVEKLGDPSELERVMRGTE